MQGVRGKGFIMKQAKVIILAGQSNAVGVGHTKYLPRFYDEETISAFYNGYDNVKIRYYSHDTKNHTFEKVRVNQTEVSKDTLGPEVGIAKRLTEKYPEEEFFVIKCAYGGSSMVNGWRSPSSGVPYRADMVVDAKMAISSPAHRPDGWCYHEMIEVMTDSLAQLREMGYEPRIVGFCWMQGESDCGSPATAEPYMFRYECLLKDLRETFAPCFEECVYVDAGISERWVDYDKLNEKKRAYAKACGSFFVDTVAAGLTTKNEPEEAPDTAHYDVESTVRLGELFADCL